MKAQAVFTIRQATNADSTSIAALISELGYPTTESDMRRRLTTIEADANYRTLVAHVGSEVVGVAGVGLAPYYERNGTYGRLGVLAVGEAHRRQGLGRALVEAVEAWALAQGASLMLVNSGRPRENAHQFYEAVGYASTGLRFVKQLDSAV